MPTPHSLDCSSPLPFSNLQPFVFGTATNPAGVTLTADGVSFLEDGRRVIPVMGEFHFVRYPQAEWRDAVLKMKAGGITVVATYVFWIFHEERRGEFRWDADRDLAAFVRTVHDAGLRCVVRVGPWCHGEVRNGGLPEWLFDRNIPVRNNDATYLGEVRRWFAAIADELRGTLWKDGGPVIGVQIENEYGGPAEHLLTLREIAIEAGLDVPYYTRTGWPELKTPMEFGKLLPLYGGYAEGFWDRALTPMPGAYWKEFVFKSVRTDAAIANEQFGTREAKDEAGTDRYPYLTCELGAGMMCSYHRRIRVAAYDPLSMCVTRLGSGSNLPGYYMYHGGTNPAGHEPWLNEHQATRYTNYNDLPVKTYDFQTAVGEFGQLREQYHLLRPIHLFLQDFGSRLAALPTVLPEQNASKTDSETLRYAVRTDGHRGFVFVNNYQRGLPMPAKTGVQFKLKLADGELTLPAEPTTVAADRSFVWPFNVDLGDGVRLDYATAQLVCQLQADDATYTVFMATGNAAEFSLNGHVTRVAEPGRGVAISVAGTRPHRLVLLSEADAKQLYKVDFLGRERLLLTDAGVIVDGDRLRLTTTAASTTVAMLPADASCRGDARVARQPLVTPRATQASPLQEEATPADDGVFRPFTLSTPASDALTATFTPLRPAGPPRTIRLGTAGVAAQPTDADFADAAEWRITFPSDLPANRRFVLRITYAGDVARVYLGDALVTDNFYNGTPFDIGLWRLDNEAVRHNGLTLKILPWQADAPIYLPDEARPDIAGQPAVAAVIGIEIIGMQERVITQ